MYRNLNELLNVNDIFYFRSHKNYKDRNYNKIISASEF